MSARPNFKDLAGSKLKIWLQWKSICFASTKPRGQTQVPPKQNKQNAWQQLKKDYFQLKKISVTKDSHIASVYFQYALVPLNMGLLLTRGNILHDVDSK
jgi:hypothetical protein